MLRCDAQGVAKKDSGKCSGPEGGSVASRLVRGMVSRGVHLVAVSGYSTMPRDAEGQLAFPDEFPATLDVELEGLTHSLQYERTAFLLHELVEPQCVVPLTTASLVMQL